MINTSYESKKCSECNKYFGMKENDYKCSRCSGIKLNNLKIDDNIEILKNYKYFEKHHFNIIKTIIKNKDNLENSMFKMIYKLIIKKERYKERFLAFTINLYIGLLSRNILPDLLDIYSNKNIIEHLSILNDTKDVKYLLSLEQANELLDILKLENYGEKEYILSHSVAKWLKKPWIQSNKFHHSSLCFYGNFGEIPNLKSGMLFKLNHNILLTIK